MNIKIFKLSKKGPRDEGHRKTIVVASYKAPRIFNIHISLHPRGPVQRQIVLTYRFVVEKPTLEILHCLHRLTFIRSYFVEGISLANPPSNACDIFKIRPSVRNIRRAIQHSIPHDDLIGTNV